jgi:hypothetical protein
MNASNTTFVELEEASLVARGVTVMVCVPGPSLV